MYGVKSNEGIITLAKDKQQALDWAKYQHTTCLGPVGDVAVEFHPENGWSEL